MASIKTGNGPTAMHNNFEDVVAHLLPYDLMEIKWTAGANRGAGLISSMEPVQVNDMEVTKPSIGKTGVQLH